MEQLWADGYSGLDVIGTFFRITKTEEMDEGLKLEFIKVRADAARVMLKLLRGGHLAMADRIDAQETTRLIKIHQKHSCSDRSIHYDSSLQKNCPSLPETRMIG